MPPRADAQAPGITFDQSAYDVPGARSVLVSVVDPHANRNPMLADTIPIELAVLNPGTVIDQEQGLAVETGPNTGHFGLSIDITLTGNPTPGNNKLEPLPGYSLRASFQPHCGQPFCPPGPILSALAAVVGPSAWRMPRGNPARTGHSTAILEGPLAEECSYIPPSGSRIPSEAIIDYTGYYMPLASPRGPEVHVLNRDCTLRYVLAIGGAAGGIAAALGPDNALYVASSNGVRQFIGREPGWNVQRALGPHPVEIIVQDDAVVVKGGDELLVLRLPTGAEIFAAARGVSTPPRGGGIALGPTSIFDVSQEGPDCFLTSFNLFTGRQDWRLNLRQQPGAIEDCTRPAIGPDGTIYVGIWFGNFGQLVAVSPFGQPLWRFDTQRRITVPAIWDRGILVFGDSRRTHALNFAGELLWSTDRFICSKAPPVVDGTGRFFCAGTLEEAPSVDCIIEFDRGAMEAECGDPLERDARPNWLGIDPNGRLVITEEGERPRVRVFGPQ